MAISSIGATNEVLRMVLQALPHLVPRCSPSHMHAQDDQQHRPGSWKLAPPEWSIMKSVPKVTSITGPRIDRSKEAL